MLHTYFHADCGLSGWQLQEVFSHNKTLLTQKVTLEHSLEGKVLETTELSNKIALLETQLASTHDVCKGWVHLFFPFALLAISWKGIHLLRRKVFSSY
jgi:hypothetical protein